MKKAKVSSVYEGRRRKRGREEEERMSRRARINARVRKYYGYYNRASVNKGQAHLVVTTEKRMIKNNRSSMIKNMVMTVGEKNGQVHDDVINEEKINVKEAAVILDPNKAKSTESEEIVELEAAGSGFRGVVVAEEAEGNTVMEKWEEWPVWWEEYWPSRWSNYEEQYPPYWEVMSGVGGGGGRQDDDGEEPWEDDIWKLRDIKEVPELSFRH